MSKLLVQFPGTKGGTHASTYTEDGILLGLLVKCYSVLCFREEDLGLLFPPRKSRPGSLRLPEGAPHLPVGPPLAWAQVPTGAEQRWQLS